MSAPNQLDSAEKSNPAESMRILLICHQAEMLNRGVVPRWLASFSTLAGIIALRETGRQKRRRIQREVKRVGLFGFLDVVLFRLYYRLFLARADRRWEEQKRAELFDRYPEIPVRTPVLECASPNSAPAKNFIAQAKPDLMIARCKVILKEEIFSIPTCGTFVMHPGICPEYRNAHGCFWALANRDLERVGMTLLRIDRGVDTGPIFAFYHCQLDEIEDSHIIIQHRTVFENLDDIQAQLTSIYRREAIPIDVTGRKSAAWGQPWMTRYLSWKRAAKRRPI